MWAGSPRPGHDPQRVYTQHAITRTVLPHTRLGQPQGDYPYIGCYGHGTPFPYICPTPDPLALPACPVFAGIFLLLRHIRDHLLVILITAHH